MAVPPVCPNAFVTVAPQRVHVCAEVHVADEPGLCPNALPYELPHRVHIGPDVHVADPPVCPNAA